jgi:hypothetical protein
MVLRKVGNITLKKVISEVGSEAGIEVESIPIREVRKEAVRKESLYLSVLHEYEL